MKLLRKRMIICIWGGLLLIGCSSGIETEEVEESIVTLRLVEVNGGNPTTHVSEASPGILEARVTDVNGTPITNLVVEFSTSELGILDPPQA